MPALRAIYEKYVSSWGFGVIGMSRLEEAEEQLKGGITVSIVLLSMHAASLDDVDSSSSSSGSSFPFEANSSGASPASVAATVSAAVSAVSAASTSASATHSQAAGDNKQAGLEFLKALRGSQAPSLAQVLGMKKDCFRGVSVVVMTPFREHSDFRLPGRDSATSREAVTWQTLPKPIGAIKLFSTLSHAFSDDPDNGKTLAIDRGLASLAIDNSQLSHPARSLAVGGPYPFRILIVDNHPVNQKLLMWIIDSEKRAICDLASNGHHACDCVCWCEYDLVLMDINMPGMTGIEASLQIRKLEQIGKVSTFSDRLPIVGMTAQKIKYTETEYTAMGMDDFLDWPIDGKSVNKKVDQFVMQSASERPPVINVSIALELCENNHAKMVTMLEEFVRTNILQLGMLRNGLLTEQFDKLVESADSMRLTAQRFGCAWLTRAASEFIRLLPGMPAVTPKSKSGSNDEIHEMRLHALKTFETEIIRISRSLPAIRGTSSPATESTLRSISEEEESDSRRQPERKSQGSPRNQSGSSESCSVVEGELVAQLSGSDGMTATQEGPPAAHLQGKDDKVL